MDQNCCPPILRGEYVVHVPYKKDIIKYALDNFPQEYHKRKGDDVGDRVYPVPVYKSLGLEAD
jgi:hypothetical protein